MGGWIWKGSSHLSCNGIKGISLLDLYGKEKEKKRKRVISNLYRIVASEYGGSLLVMEKTENRENFCCLLVRHVSNQKKKNGIIRSMKMNDEMKKVV